MSVYADNMRRYARVDRSSRRVITGRWSQLLADSPAELAAFAAGLGLRPEWLHYPGTAREHYELVEAVRRRVVAAGAIPISYPRDTDNLILTKRLQASALDAASRRWHVFPLRPGTKIPAVRDWDHQASTDPERDPRSVDRPAAAPRMACPRTIQCWYWLRTVRVGRDRPRRRQARSRPGRAAAVAEPRL
jgi:hypothetical protein